MGRAVALITPWFVRLCCEVANVFFKLVLKNYCLCVCTQVYVCMCVCIAMCVMTRVEFRGQLLRGVSSCLLPCGFGD